MLLCNLKTFIHPNTSSPLIPLHVQTVTSPPLRPDLSLLQTNNQAGPASGTASLSCAQLEFHLKGAVLCRGRHLHKTHRCKNILETPNMFPHCLLIRIHNPECLADIQLHHVP